MNTSTKIAIAVVGGYVLGRRRKARLALVLGSWLVGSRLNIDVKKLGREAVQQLASHAEIVKLGGSVRDELLQAAKGAAMTAVTGRMEGLSNRLHEKTNALSVPGQVLSSRDEDEDEEGSDSPRDADAPRAADEPRDSDTTRDADESPEDGEEAPAKPRKRRAPQAAKKAADAAPKKAKPAKRAARRRPSSDDEPARTPRKRSTTSDRPARPSRSRTSSRGSKTDRS
ncbi:MAG: hypothetical protein WCA46_18340 [Actinocatenispora sp.]